MAGYHKRDIEKGVVANSQKFMKKLKKLKMPKNRVLM